MNRTLLMLTLFSTLGATAHAYPRVAPPPFLESLDLPLWPQSSLATRRSWQVEETKAHPVQVTDEGAALGAANYANLASGDWNTLHQDLTIDLDWNTGVLVLDAILTVHANASGVNELDFLGVTGETWSAKSADGAVLDIATSVIQDGYSKYAIKLDKALDPAVDTKVTVHRESKLDCSPGFQGFLTCNLAGTYKWMTGSVGLRLYPGTHDPYAVTQHIITSPQEVAAATGKSMGYKTLSNGRRMWTFDNAERGDNTDAFAVAAYKVFETQGSTGIPISIYTTSNYTSTAKDIAKFTGEVIDFYAARMAAFPWQVINMIQLSGKFGGGMSFVQGIFAIQNMFGVAPGDDGWESAAELLAHELGHQWWGNYVSPQSLSDVCLSESMAEFSSCWYMELVQGTRSQMLGNNLGFVYTVSKADDRAVHSAGVYGSPKYVEIIYHKGAVLYDMLRNEIGDEAMAKGLAAYATQYGRDYATLAQQRAQLEKASGKDLGWFFSQWFDRTGHIRSQIAARSTPNEDGTWTAHVRLVQPSDPANSKQKPYRFELPIRIELAGGLPAQDRVMSVVAVADEAQYAEFVVPGPVLRVKPDLERKLLRKFVIGTPGDVNLSGLVDGADFVDMAYRQGRGIVRSWGGGGQEYFVPDPSWNELYDINADKDGNAEPDGSIDSLDLKALADWYGFTAEEF